MRKSATSRSRAVLESPAMHPATIREPARDLRVADSADVVVAGGGVAGIAARSICLRTASVRSGRQRARTPPAPSAAQAMTG